MIPFKWRYVILIILLFTIGSCRIYYVNAQFPKVEIIERKQGETFSWKDTEVTVIKSEFISEDDIERIYGGNQEVLNTLDMYNMKATPEWKRLAVYVDMKGITTEQFEEMKHWHIAYGVSGNGVSYLTDVVNNEITDTPEHKEVVFFFECNFTLEDKDNVEFLLRTNIYPTVEYVKLDL